MRIALLGGGTGGHFYPLLAVARELQELRLEQHLLKMDIVLYGDDIPDLEALVDDEIVFEPIFTGKRRKYRSVKNLTDPFRVLIGVVQMLWKFTLNPPDVIFSKGGYAAFPSLVAARLYRIPVIIHETDTIPGKVNRYAAKFAKRIAITFPESAKFFDRTEAVALTGQPIRKNILGGTDAEGYDIFHLEEGLPTILVLGGSQGAQIINELIISALPRFVTSFQIIHQTGKANYDAVKNEASVALENTAAELHGRYHPMAFLNEAELRNAGHVSNLVISRAGGGSIAEIAAWNSAAILIPLPEDVDANGHQKENAFNYARLGAAEVLGQKNLTPNLLYSRSARILEDKAIQNRMTTAAQRFSRLGAAREIAEEILKLATH